MTTRAKQIQIPKGDDTLVIDNASCPLSFPFQTEAEVGVVERIELTNFMCHTFLEVNFGANVNFVIGRNGSK